jgi:hypothetical protein
MVSVGTNRSSRPPFRLDEDLPYCFSSILICRKFISIDEIKIEGQYMLTYIERYIKLRSAHGIALQ